MNWKIIAPLVLAVVAIGVYAMLGTGKSGPVAKGTPDVSPVATQPVVETSPVVSTPPPAVAQTGDPIEDIFSTLGTENTGDQAVLSAAAADAALVTSDSGDLSALTTTYDQTSF